MLHYDVSAKDIACQPRLRELKALAEVERLKGKLEAVAAGDSSRALECPPLLICPDDKSLSCPECWQKWIDETQKGK